MKKLIIFAVILVFLIACTKISLEGAKELKTAVQGNNTKENKTMIKNIEERVGEKLPALNTETNYDTPSSVESKALKDTEAEDFGDVI